MARLAFLPVLAALVFPTGSAAVAGSPQWDAPVAEASARFGIPIPWIERVINAESGGRTILNGRAIRSRVGAMGLMQLMPGTWRAMRQTHGLGRDPDDPRDNILAGTAYLRAMYDRFGYPGLFGAYNAGPARYADHLATGRRLPLETVAYVAKITRGTPRAPNRLLASPALSGMMVEKGLNDLRETPGGSPRSDRDSVFFGISPRPDRPAADQ